MDAAPLLHAEREVPAVLMASAHDGLAPIGLALAEARAELLEAAVLANAEGWQSGPIEPIEYPPDHRMRRVVGVTMQMRPPRA